MIRLIQRRLIIPRGDTGSFSIPVLKNSTDNIAVFTIFDEVTHTKMFQKMVPSEGDVINIAFTHSDTVNLKPGKYVWDIKYYSNPEYIDDELVNGEEIDSYYAGFSLPVCEIRETADNYLVSPEAPTATLSPQQLEIVTGAIHSLNEAIRKTQENVEHYPEIRNEVWYVWDAELGDYVSTNVRANGIVGNGIASAVLNNDYTLTLNFTDGTSFTSPSIRGQRGNGIEDIVLNNDFTLTITYTDGDSYTTPSIRGSVGATPQFSIGTVQDGAVAAASITGTAENPVLNLTLPNANVPTRVSELENDSGYLTEHQDLSDYVQKTDYADDINAGLIRVNSNYGLTNVSKQDVITGESVIYTAVMEATANNIKEGTDRYRIISSRRTPNATFYGLAKAAGDTTQSQSSNAVGTYTNEAKAAIQTMLDVPSNADIPTQVSELTNDAGYLTAETDPTVPAWAKAAQKPSYTAAEVGAPTVAEMNTAIGTAIGQINSFDMAVVQTLPTQDISTHTIYLVPKTGETNDVYDEYVYIDNKWEMVGNTQIDLSNYATKSEIPDTSIYATKADTVLDTTLSRGRKKDTTIGEGSFAFGSNVEASGANSFAIGNYATAKGESSYARGTYAKALGNNSSAEGSYIHALAASSHAEGGASTKTIKFTGEANAIIYSINSFIPVGSIVSNPSAPNGTCSLVMRVEQIDDLWYVTLDNTLNSESALIEQRRTVYIGGALETYSHTEGSNSIAIGPMQHVEGKNNYADINYAHIVGNGFTSTQRSNAYALDWDGNGHYAGDVYVHANTDSSGGTKLATIEDIPEVPVTDVQVAGVSVLSDGVANVPVASNNNVGVVKTSNQYGIANNPENGLLFVTSSTSPLVKAGTDDYNPISPKKQHESTFYGLSKVAGVDLANETVTLGTYPETSKTAIRSMIGAASTNVIAVQDTQPTDTDTKIWLPETAETPVQVPTVEEMNTALSEKVDDVQVNGVSVVSNGVANVPVATVINLGVVKSSATEGIVIDASGVLKISTPSSSDYKALSNKKAIILNAAHHAVFYALAKAAGDTTQSASSNPVGTYTDDAKAAIQQMLDVPSNDDIPDVPVQDVQVNGVSVLDAQGVANVPVATSNGNYGAVRIDTNYGIASYNNNGTLMVVPSNSEQIKTGTNGFRPIVATRQHESTFYGLAKAAGDITQSASSNAVGVYTDNAKASIKSMLGIQDGSTGTVDITGATPTINAVENTRYVCGEVTSLSFTPPSSGISIVRFTSGSTVTVLTIPSTVKFPEWFDPTALETNTIYEICVTDGTFGAVMSWAL